jgi:hypothetical protein
MTLTLNTALLREVADHIEREPERFNLAHFSTADSGDDLQHGCGTTACVAGWANALTGARSYEELANTIRAAEQLGLARDQAERLFYWTASFWCDVADDLGLEVDSPGTPFRSINPGQLTGVLAAKGLRMLADGEVTL